MDKSVLAELKKAVVQKLDTSRELTDNEVLDICDETIREYAR